MKIKRLLLIFGVFFLLTITLVYFYFHDQFPNALYYQNCHFSHMETIAPHIIHQSWKTQNLPRRFQRWSQSWKNCFPTWNYTLWTNEDNRQLLNEHYTWLLDFYDRLPSEIYRADIIRYVYMHHFGGIYADLDVECLQPFEHLLKNYTIVFGAMVGVDGPPVKEGIIENHFFYSEAKHPFWLELLHDCMQGKGGPVQWTGPSMLGYTINKHRHKYDNEWKIYEPKYFNPFSWYSDVNRPKECRTQNRMTEENVKTCADIFKNNGSYAVHYHAASWGSGIIVKK